MRRLSDHPAEQREFGYRRPPPHNGLPAANETVSAISDRFVSEYAALDPTNAVRALGIGKDSTGLTDHSPAGTDELAGLLWRTLRDLSASRPTTESERVGADFLVEWATAQLGLIESGEPTCLMSELVGPQAQTRTIFDLMDNETAQDWETIATRLEKVPGAMAGYIESLSAGLGDGNVASVRLVDGVVNQCRTWAGDGSGGWFQGFAAAHGEGSLGRRLTSAGAAADEAYGRLGQWLANTYAPLATETDGVGVDRYQIAAAAQLGASNFDLADAYDWGWQELARIEAERKVECARILPGASCDEVMHLLTTDPSRVIDGVDNYRAWLQDVTDEATEGLNGLEFDIPEQLVRCDVSIPPLGCAAAPYYSPPSEDLSSPGTTWFPTLGATRFPRWNQVTTAYHEAVPGHHLQLGMTRLLPLTRFQRVAFNAAHGEGWALYAERLMDELGWFRTPDTRLGFLSMQAFRAARVVVDIGLHTKCVIPTGWHGAGEKWNIDLAVTHLRAAGGQDESFAKSEALRYLSMPAQAISYKIGERAWLEARSRARAKHGSSFDRKSWHSAALGLGALGLDQFAAEMDAI